MVPNTDKGDLSDLQLNKNYLLMIHQLIIKLRFGFQLATVEQLLISADDQLLYTHTV